MRALEAASAGDDAEPFGRFIAYCVARAAAGFAAIPG